MKLKQLHEKARWSKLSETDFKIQLVEKVSKYDEDFEKLFNITTDLMEQIDKLKNQITSARLENVRLNRKINPNMRENDDDQTKQNRNSESISKSR